MQLNSHKVYPKNTENFRVYQKKDHLFKNNNHLKTISDIRRF